MKINKICNIISFFTYKRIYRQTIKVFIMEKIQQAKLITPMDVAKLLGVEKEYKDVLFEQELKRNHDIIMSDDFENKNNSKDNENNS